MVENDDNEDEDDDEDEGGRMKEGELGSSFVLFVG
jgi:hypothetical protein